MENTKFSAKAHFGKSINCKKWTINENSNEFIIIDDRVTRSFNMLYTLLLYLLTILSFSFNIVWLLCKITSYGIPWFTLVFIFIFIASKFVRLTDPNAKHLIGDFVDSKNFCIANRGGFYDCPENSFAALKEVSYYFELLFTLNQVSIFQTFYLWSYAQQYGMTHELNKGS